MTADRLIPLSELADRLHYEGRDRARSVRRCFQRHGLHLLQRDGRSVFATERLYQELIQRMQTCSNCDAEARSSRGTIRVGRATREHSTGSREREAALDYLHRLETEIRAEILHGPAVRARGAPRG
jgi:hypothetical protein